MNNAAQPMLQQKYVAFDTSTWIELFKHRTGRKYKTYWAFSIPAKSPYTYLSITFWSLCKHTGQNGRLAIWTSYGYKTCGLPKTYLRANLASRRRFIVDYNPKG